MKPITHTMAQLQTTIKNLHTLYDYVDTNVTQNQIFMEAYFAVPHENSVGYLPSTPEDIIIEEMQAEWELGEGDDRTHQIAERYVYLQVADKLNKTTGCGAVACMLGHAMIALSAPGDLIPYNASRKYFPALHQSRKHMYAYDDKQWGKVFGPTLSPSKTRCLRRIRQTIRKLEIMESWKQKSL